MRSIRYERLFDRKQRCVVIAMDHGLFDGPIPGLVNLPETASKIAPCVDGVLLSPAMLPHCTDTFNYKGAPLAVVRLNWSTTYCFKWSYHRAATVLAFPPEGALRLGGDVALVSLTLETGNEADDAENVRVFRELCASAQRLGMPVIASTSPPHPRA